MAQELECDDEATFYYLHHDRGSIEVTLSKLIGEIITQSRDLQFLRRLLHDILRGWNEYLAEVRSHVASVSPYLNVLMEFS